MKRIFTLQEQFGIYTASAGGVKATSRTPEKALLSLSRFLGVGEPQVRNTADVGEWFEALLGPKCDESDGPVAA